MTDATPEAIWRSPAALGPEARPQQPRHLAQRVGRVEQDDAEVAAADAAG